MDNISIYDFFDIVADFNDNPSYRFQFPPLYRRTAIQDIKNYISTCENAQLIFYKDKNPYSCAAGLTPQYSIILLNHWYDQMWLYFFDKKLESFIDNYHSQYKTMQILDTIRLSSFFDKKPYYILPRKQLTYIRKTLVKIIVKFFLAIGPDIILYDRDYVFLVQLEHTPIIKFIKHDALKSMYLLAYIRQLYCNRDCSAFNDKVTALFQEPFKPHIQLYEAIRMICNKLLCWRTPKPSIDTIKCYELLKQCNLLHKTDIEYYDKKFANVFVKIMATNPI